MNFKKKNYHFLHELSKKFKTSFLKVKNMLFNVDFINYKHFFAVCFQLIYQMQVLSTIMTTLVVKM